MSIECIKDANLEETGFNYTMSLIQGKYKMFILYALMGFKVVRFNELKKYIKTISYKTLSVTLKELEADGLIHREEYPQIPPKVEYSLTERGASLIPILDSMCEWGEKNRLQNEEYTYTKQGQMALLCFFYEFLFRRFTIRQREQRLVRTAAAVGVI